MPRGRLVGIGLMITLLLTIIACGDAGSISLRSARSQGAGSVSPFLTPSLGPFQIPTPFTIPTSTPTLGPPTPTPAPTALPTATPFASLDELRKTPQPATTVLGHGLSLPPGFKIDTYAVDLPGVARMAYSSDGVLFASLPGKGAVIAMPAGAGQDKAASLSVFAQGMARPTGLTFHGDYLYVAEANRVVRYRYTPGQRSAMGTPEVVVPDLPVGSGFLNHAIGFGPDGKLYVSIGASCNACQEADNRRATIMRYNEDGSQGEIFARGLRNVEAFSWYPNSGQFLATNCNRRLMGDNLPPDTIELVQAGGNFGWPFCHAGNVLDPELGSPEACAGVPPPFQQLPAQSSPKGMCAYTGGQFPQEYYGDIFVTLYGSWERRVPVGYKIVRLDVEDGKVVGVKDFCSGWLTFDQHWGRPVDVIQAPDGSLLVSDDQANVIYRIYHEG